MPWFDTPDRYGLVSRALHWGMAALFAWQFAGMLVRLTVGRAPITAFMVGSHASIGTLLFLLLLARAGWALVNRRRRPGHPRGVLGRAALLGHLALYAAMLVVPVLALLRAYGSGRPFAVFGLPLLPGGRERIEALMAPANLLHGNLAWLLLALVGGHVAMVALHRWRWRDDVWARMGGRLRPER